MLQPTRAHLARTAYAAALAVARERSTPASWRRLVRAGQNLREALAREREAAPRARPEILLVEDDAGTREALRELLEARGMRVVTAEHGLAALELLRRRRVSPRAIVLDLELPVMDGRELRQALLRDPALARIPVVVVSGSHDDAPVPGASRLRKPLEPAALVEAIARASRT